MLVSIGKCKQGGPQCRAGAGRRTSGAGRLGYWEEGYSGGEEEEEEGAGEVSPTHHFHRRALGVRLCRPLFSLLNECDPSFDLRSTWIITSTIDHVMPLSWAPVLAQSPPCAKHKKVFLLARPVRLVVGFILREKYCWLVVGGWFVLREKYCWLVADKPNE
jgi:hypothetical protein